MDAEDNEAKIKENTINDGSKKSVHRDIERQRRKEMAALYASLRSILPLEYVKGKRAKCDHMEQAMNYIKDIQQKIEEMKMRKNKINNNAQSTNSNMSSDCVKINLLKDGGMEILITTTPCFPLSKVLAFLFGIGLNVTTCISTRSGVHYSFHKFQIQVNEIRSIDISELKERLVNLIKLIK